MVWEETTGWTSAAYWDDSTEEDAATDSEEEEEDNLPPTGETNYLMVSIIGLVFIGSGVALAFTFKKDERTE